MHKTSATPPRARASCDACALRRVRCAGGRPCTDCHRRGIACTHLRERRKRGPKGPRLATVEKIESYKETLANAQQMTLGMPSPPSDGSVATSELYRGDDEEKGIGMGNRGSKASKIDLPRTASSPPSPASPPSWSYAHAPAAYHAHLDIFQRRLYTVWPIVDAPGLIQRLAGDVHARDGSSHALAAALCAAVIAQLRLDQRPEPGIDSRADAFAREAQFLRRRGDYRESPSLDSLLTSFFLHIYFSNVQKLSTATYLLRETATTAHLLRLPEPETYETLPPNEYQRRLLVFWILFVTERTFCAQNDLVPILHPISEFPALERTYDSSNPHTSSSPSVSFSPMAGFTDLARLFIYLEAAFFRSEPPSRITTGSQADKVKILCMQSQLEQPAHSPLLSETQSVDLNVTRHWIRTIIWRYTITHFTPSAQSRVPAFSALYPAQIAKDTLALLSRASAASICAHGYGMELKILRLANSVLDVLVCLPALKYSMATSGCREVLCALETILQTVGGGGSRFAQLLQRRMLETDLPTSLPRDLPLPVDLDVGQCHSFGGGRLLDGSGIYEVEEGFGEEDGFVEVM